MAGGRRYEVHEKGLRVLEDSVWDKCNKVHSFKGITGHHIFEI